MADNVQPFDPRIALRTLASGKKDPHGDAEGEVKRPEGLERHNHSSTVILCKDVADLLVRHYPDWAWAVQPDERGQVINVFNLNLHTNYGYTIRMDDIMYDMSRRAAVRAGGEILARFKMPRRMDRAMLAAAPRDAAGQCIPDISDFKSKKERQNAEIAMGLATGTMEIVETAEGHRYLQVKG